MVFLKLFFNFLIVGAFSFGGAYSAIPLVKDVTERFDMISAESIADFVAIAESTPGPVGVNLATFVGTKVSGLTGALIATLAEVLPAFVIMLLFSIYFRDVLQNRKFRFALSVIRPCVVAIIMAVGISLFIDNTELYIAINTKSIGENLIKGFIISILLIVIMKLYDYIAKKRLSAISLIVFGAIFGIAINNLI